MSMWITHNYTKEERRNTPLSWNLRPTSRQNIIHHQSTKNPNMRSQRALMGQNTKKLQLDTKPQPTRPLLMTRQQHMKHPQLTMHPQLTKHLLHTKHLQHMKLQQQLMRHQQLMKNQQPRNQNMKNQQSTRSLSQNQRRRDIREDTFGNDPSLEKENELPNTLES